MGREEAYKYHEALIRDGNIITIQDGEFLAGYLEMWRITFCQFGRIICGEPFSATNENILNGQIAYVANTYIYPKYRNTFVAKMLRDRFYEFNKDCTHFCGHAIRKKTGLIKVFTRDKISAILRLDNVEEQNESKLKGMQGMSSCI